MMALLRRFAVATVVGFVLITGGQLLRGRPWEVAAGHGLLWAAIAAAIFTANRWYRLRRGERCAVCGDGPEDLPASRDGVR